MEYKHDQIIYHELDDLQKIKKIEALKSFFEKEPRVKLAYLFGSFLRRNKVRDIDVAIYTVPALEFEEFLRLGVRIELEISMPVDVVQIQELDPAFRYKVLRQAEKIIIKDGKLHNILESQALSEISSLKISKHPRIRPITPTKS
jgi:predicted nucleotidyltransferase